MSRRKDISGMTAVVTGASSGIGFCFCRELASRGCGIVMISNQGEQLRKAAEEIAGGYGVPVHVLELDLTWAGSSRRVIGFLEANSIRADILINNAGIFSFMPVESVSSERLDCFIDLHVRAVTMLSRDFAAMFRRQGGGYILNMSSMSCWMPMPGIAMYSASKAYIRAFSRALHCEMRDYGVGVTVACPGGIATDLFGLPERLKRLAVRIGALDTPARFARKAVDITLRRRQQYINGWLNRLAIVFVGTMPRRVRMIVKHRMLDRGITR